MRELAPQTRQAEIMPHVLKRPAIMTHVTSLRNTKSRTVIEQLVSPAAGQGHEPSMTEREQDFRGLHGDRPRRRPGESDGAQGVASRMA